MPSGECKVICATSAFGAGIDYAHVRLVVHCCGSSSVLDYAQETERAGRDNKDADCIILAYKQYHTRFSKATPPPPQINEANHNLVGKSEFARYILGDGCLRYQLQSSIDRDAQACVDYNGDVRLCMACAHAMDQVRLMSLSLS
ncbi:predicted protein [Lichtheimia corymbifera JMRC:FSU:9682]|uniref:DNA 3'-5' helicase n=1 Tax=Lichtheimia corymbifera JMRC:FSU:9682 TaxID=1263082 RepID=A0A068SG44_9FUNG|nr:predicted protein [Lichtheimia corymbifera JMRC:FSU:9682]